MAFSMRGSTISRSLAGGKRAFRIKKVAMRSTRKERERIPNIFRNFFIFKKWLKLEFL
jgi:hypothetical protein